MLIDAQITHLVLALSLRGRERCKIGDGERIGRLHDRLCSSSNRNYWNCPIRGAILVLRCRLVAFLSGFMGLFQALEVGLSILGQRDGSREGCIDTHARPMRQLIVLDVHGGKTLRVGNTVDHDRLDTSISDIHSADIEVHESWSREDQLLKGLAEVVNVVTPDTISVAVHITINHHIVSEAETLKALLKFELDADEGEVFSSHLAVDELEVLYLWIRLCEDKEVLLALLRERHVR